MQEKAKQGVSEEKLERFIKREFSKILSFAALRERRFFAKLYTHRRLREEVEKSCKKVLAELEKSN